MNRQGKLFLIFSVLIFAGALGIVLYYIWGNAFITELQSDCTDTLLWAQASLESGKLFKPGFDYAYRLAFGGQWLFMPFLKLFGVGTAALRCGMTLFTLVFAAALVFFFRSLGCRAEISFAEAGIMLLALCATKKTREIFYGHVIHYSLAVFYLMLAFIFLRLLLRGKGVRGTLVPGTLLTLVLFMCSANGTVEILYVTLPLLIGCLIEAFLSGRKKLLVVCACVILAAGAGYLFSNSLNTHYSDGYSVVVPWTEWAENFLRIPVRWISLFYPLPERNLDSFTSLWIRTVFKAVIALVILAGFLLSFSRYKTLKRAEERIFVFTAWAMFAAFLFFFVFGKISDVDWRMTPLLFAGEVVVLLLFNQLDLKAPERTLSGGLALLCGAVLVLQAASNGLSVLRIPYDRKIWYAEDGLLETLKANGLDYGYITSYWLSNSVTVLSDDTIRVRAVSFDDGHLYLNPFNSDLAWYDDQPERDRYFLAMKESQYDPELPFVREALETYTCFQEDTRNSIKENYVILVFDHNIMKEEHDALVPRYY